MKKIVIGIIIGAVLMYSGQAVATSVSKIGKKVQAEYDVVVNGKTLPVKALSIDGQTTTPNRALADAIGYDVRFENSKVVFTEIEEESQVNLNIQDQLNIVNGDIESLEVYVRVLEGSIQLDAFDTEEERTNNKNQLSDYKKRISELKERKAKLEAQLQ